MIAIPLYLSAILFPGYFFTKLIERDLNSAVFAKSVAYSLSLIASLIAICIYFNFPPDVFYIALGAISAALFLIYIVAYKGIDSQFSGYSLAAFLIISLVSLTYHLIMGVYDELPADFYIHLEFFKFSDTFITERNDFHFVSLGQLFSKNAQYWYYAISLFANLDQASLIDLMPYFMMANVTVFLLAVNSFCLHIFKDYLSPVSLFFCGLLATFFTAFHMGINVFSFIRYYAAAPVILTMIVYFSAVVVLVDYLNKKINHGTFIFSSTLFFIAAAMLHRQEAMFIATAFLIIPICAYYSEKFCIQNKHSFLGLSRLPSYCEPRSLVLLIVTSLALFIVYIYTVKNNYHNNAIYPKLISMEKIWSEGKELFTLNPLFQFYTVLTHWGLWLYFLYLIFYRWFNRNITIRALMLVPIVTVFNPLFVHFFLHVTDSHVLWRFLYMLPIYFVAAYIVISIVTNKSHTNNHFIKVAQYGLMLPLFVFLFPIKTPSLELPYSRVDTLKAVEKSNSAEHWQDMLDYLNKLPGKKNIITDPVTGYLITAMTPHHNNRYKFIMNPGIHKYLLDSYEDDPFQKYSGSLFVLNLREGDISKSGEISAHWPGDVLKTGQYYNEALIEYLSTNRNRFNLIFSQDSIQIYSIR